MIFRQILLQIFHKLQQQRSISAAYHLLKGKRSGQTIQDVGIFKLHDYFGLLPKLSRSLFDQEIAQLVSANLINELSEGRYILLNQALEKMPLSFDGWHYRGNEHIFFHRLALVVQSLSHHKEQKMSFSPIIKDDDIQQWVRQFLLQNNYQTGKLQPQLYDEIVNSIKQLSLDEKQIQIVVNRLSGYGIPGLTWQQLAYDLQQEPLDVQLEFISMLHQWLNQIYNHKSFPLLNAFAQGVRIEAYVTSSARQTAEYFWRGYSIEQISELRRLKISTIEDHLVELAMNESNFPIEQFISDEDATEVRQMIEALQTKKLKLLYTALERFSYFQLRLVLARGED